MKTVRDVSAGGVVYRRRDGRLEIVLVGRAQPPRWGLPKGAPTRRESLEEAALREVREETGIEARLVCPLAAIDYWFTLNGVRHAKTVHFYLMEATGGDTANHDHEYDLAEWFALPEARRVLSYRNEQKVLERAEAALERGACDAERSAKVQGPKSRVQ
jgi:ADP-ribose pyrophosphatase YjhB (NUDIX family)